jgi:hypothetical protein
LEYDQLGAGLFQPGKHGHVKLSVEVRERWSLTSVLETISGIEPMPNARQDAFGHEAGDVGGKVPDGIAAERLSARLGDIPGNVHPLKASMQSPRG